MWLDEDTFRGVVASTPLVSIDLVVQNEHGELLLGHRLNRPAQGFWFVPGGRIQKNETLDEAFRRLTSGELGSAFDRASAGLLGIYEHFYTDSVFGTTEDGIDTHYVVLAYHLLLPIGHVLTLPIEQHSAYRWLSITEVEASAKVHGNSRAYLDALRMHMREGK
ncbi:ADP-ribose pyrophosphatase [Stutzerimonas stutzeri]|uniref:GDP-mannose mannosyl hydrolase n=1 Tax=Stutzerimonas stutzeri subgroup TaxID=578833 RepID=UPI000C6ED803|nr:MULTISPECIES: GDP-mannose mannosyl hydrolase [Stutzerimonas stutzeri subgroup]MCQ2047200.1 GDP-mannose mannosyl hydrolase [Stutzerimonas kunmingensis]PKR28489.1 GDP-mannose mannosyl hydrolase [Stutzerimonas stutzeri]QQC10080.1 GDP-mannose mannosyl hydrolase [Stutzerimonas stutzeri]VEI33875.1 ADP-ribose pyrophosphatase [Stutzerimonas stutzeri]